VDIGWSSGKVNEPIRLERGEKKEENGDTNITPGKSE
jgi:hypothetical protein